jgi:hypothetical protein
MQRSASQKYFWVFAGNERRIGENRDGKGDKRAANLIGLPVGLTRYEASQDWVNAC